MKTKHEEMQRNAFRATHPRRSPRRGNSASIEQKREERKLTLQLILAVSMAIFGCVMIVAAFIVPPTGEIHPSVLTAFGEILTFAGAVLGIDYNYKFKTHKKEVENEDNQ